MQVETHSYPSRIPYAGAATSSSGEIRDEGVVGRGSKPKYIVFTLSKDLTEIVVEKTGEPTSTYDEFLGTLPEAECRWAVYDFDYKREDGGIRNKLTFFSWYVPSLIPTHAHSSARRAIPSTLSVEQVGRGSGVRRGLSRDVTHTQD